MALAIVEKKLIGFPVLEHLVVNDDEPILESRGDDQFPFQLQQIDLPPVPERPLSAYGLRELGARS